jgi:antitoxin component YwqK of YwqJK toxin-antitoxin module
MKNSILILFCLFLVACTDQPGSTKSSPVDLTGYEQTPVPGSKLSSVRKDFSEKKIEEEGFILNGQKTGSWVTYHSDDRNNPKVVAHYIDGKLNGVYMELTARGQIEYIAHYKNGVLDGPFTQFKNTRKLKTGNYQDGKKHGTFTTYFERSDQVQQEVEFKNDLQDGFFRYYNEEGKMTLEYVYEKGEKISGGIVE